MSSLTVVYPVAPGNVDQKILEPTNAFKKEVWKSLAAILFFILVYILLVTLAFALAALCAAGGVGLIMLTPMFLTIMLGLGLAGLGIMVLVFLFKFLFKQNKVDRSGMVEITAAEHPELFKFIKKLSTETQTPFPKRVYVTPDVNAFVFYDSNFWSMFLPVRKNLAIGLGLVNTVNLSEFKAIIAHEFGHFSQRSMKLGAYVYNVNQIIYNLLYDTEGYQKTLESWANISGYFALFANITVRIVWSIQWVLQKVYGIVNVQYMSLSRQMEFHADTVAASVSGGDHLIDALRRIEVAEASYNTLFNYYGREFKQGLKPDNVYSHHSVVLKVYAAQLGLPMKGDLPFVSAESFARFNNNRVMIKDQWASHPSTDDREKHLRSLNIRTASLDTPAWSIFSEPEALQKEMTEKIYASVQFEKEPSVLNESTFRQRYTAEVESHEYSPIYKGYFDLHVKFPTDLNAIESKSFNSPTSLESILTPERIALPLKINGLRSDVQTITAIKDRSLPIRSFDFDGEKFKAKDAARVLHILENDLKAAEDSLQESDEAIFAYFFRLAKNEGTADRLKTLYEDYVQVSALVSQDETSYFTILNTMAPVYQRLPIEQIHQIMHSVRLQEVPIKARLKILLEDEVATRRATEADKERAGEYLAKDHTYFYTQSFNDKGLELFNDAMGIFFRLYNDARELRKKAILDFQSRLELEKKAR